MKLHRSGREYFTFPVVADVDPVPAISLSADNGLTWHPTEAVTGGIRILIAGPDATGNPDGTLVLPSGVAELIARAVDSPEVVIRGSWGIRIES